MPDGLRIRGAAEDSSDLRAPVRPAGPTPGGPRPVENRAMVPNRRSLRDAALARETPKLVIDLLRLAQQGLITPDAPHTGIATEFRVIKPPVLENTQVKAGTRPKDGNLVMVTSAMAGEGKSFCAVNLAMSIPMELDSTLLLVDSDVANPSVLELLSLPQGPGLLDVLIRPDARPRERDIADERRQALGPACRHAPRANVNAVPELDKEKSTVAFTLFIDPGRRVYVNRINVVGNTKA